VGTKALVIVVVALVVLFVAGVAAPALSGRESEPDVSAGPLEAFRGLVERPLDLRQDALFSPPDCLQTGALVMPAGGTCSLTVKPDTALFPSTRKLTLKLEQGAAVELHVTQEQAPNVTQTVKAGDAPAGVDFFRDGGTLAITCAGVAGGCRLALP
jgi:hypothetical protein